MRKTMRSQTEAEKDARYHAAQLIDALQDADMSEETIASVENIHAKLGK